MHDIKFRGLNGDGYFSYGFLTTNSNFDTVIAEWFEHGPTQQDPCGGVGTSFTVVDPETVGQYIGIKDINGAEIFQGDTVKASYEYFTGSYQEKDVEGVIVFTDWCTYAIRYFENGEETYLEIADTTHFHEPCIEVVGNTHQTVNLTSQENAA